MLTLTAAFITEMIAHAQEEAPNECCGIIAGRDGTAAKLFRAKNSEASPYRYSVDPKDLFRIYRECEESDWNFLVIYHSHTRKKPTLPTDVRPRLLA
jgi:proteasome lid subunit RPN8/RPN11